MRKKLPIILLTFLLVVAVVFGITQAALGADSTDVPAAYVISNGTDCYYIGLNDLVTSYLAYRVNPNADNARLAKFYFDTTAGNVMSGFRAYVSGVTTKFVSFGEVVNKYVATRNVDATYIWFNSLNATPAFSAITKVYVLNASGAIAGRYYVNTNGYIIRRSTYTLDATAPSQASANVPVVFTVAVTSDDLGCDSLTGSISYEVTGGNYTLEVQNGGAWETRTDGTILAAQTITPDWSTLLNVRFTAHNSGTYHLKFKLKTAEGEVLAEKTQTVAVTGAMVLSASAPTCRVGVPAQFGLTTVANGDAGKLAQAHFTIPAGATLEYLEASTGQWLALPAVYGPATGFAVADGTLMLRGTFTHAGENIITVRYVEVGTGRELASTKIKAIVEQPMAISAVFPAFYANEPATFTLTSVANDDEGKAARIHFTLPSDVTLEYQEEGTGNWIPVTNPYGPASGFAVANAAYTFRATVTGIGMKEIGIQFVEVGTDVVLASETWIATSQYRVEPTITIPGFNRIAIGANAADAVLNLENPSSNTCWFVVHLMLADGTVLYTSQPLAPGEEIGAVTLSQTLSAGTYDAIVRYEAFDDPVDLNALNSADVVVALIVS